jgi:uncharacterized protein
LSRRVQPANSKRRKYLRADSFSGSQINLGFLYLRGHGVPQDYVQAHMWFNLAAVRFPRAPAVRDFVARKMTPAQIEEAQKLARESKPK